MIIAYVNIIEDERIPDYGIKDIDVNNPLYPVFDKMKPNGECFIKYETDAHAAFEKIQMLPNVELPAMVEKFITIWSQ